MSYLFFESQFINFFVDKYIVIYMHIEQEINQMLDYA